jgi:hypothetical protein
MGLFFTYKEPLMSALIDLSVIHEESQYFRAALKCLSESLDPRDFNDQDTGYNTCFILESMSLRFENLTEQVSELASRGVYHD